MKRPEQKIKKKINTLDEIITKSMLDAEKSCGKKLGKYPVSEKLSRSRKLIKYWKIRSQHEDDELDQKN